MVYQTYKKNAEKREKLKQTAKQTTLNIFENRIGKCKVNVTDEMIHEKIADFIVSDCQAYNVVEDEAFKALIKQAFPNYKLPGFLSRLLLKFTLS